MSTIPMHVTTRTVYGNLLLSTLAWGLPYQPLEGSTLNEKWGFHANTGWPTAEMPRFHGIVVGIGGHVNTIVADDISIPSSIPHRVRDGSCFKPMPFVIRPVNGDLTPQQRISMRVAGRTLIEKNGEYWWGYYIKLTDTSNIVPEVRHTVISGGVSSSNNFVPDATVLSPVRPELPLPVLTETEGEYYSVFTPLNLGMNAAEVAEYRNVAEVLYGDPNVAVISEYGIVGGVRRTVPLLDVNGSETATNYNEILGCVITSFTTIYQNVAGANDGYNLRLNTGANEPLYGPMQTSTTP